MNTSDTHAPDPQSHLARQRRLSIQWGAAALAVALAAVILDLAVLALLVWAMFALWLALRMKAARQMVQAASPDRRQDSPQETGTDISD